MASKTLKAQISELESQLEELQFKLNILEAADRRAEIDRIVMQLDRGFGVDPFAIKCKIESIDSGEDEELYKLIVQLKNGMKDALKILSDEVDKNSQ